MTDNQRLIEITGLAQDDAEAYVRSKFGSSVRDSQMEEFSTYLCSSGVYLIALAISNTLVRIANADPQDSFETAQIKILEAVVIIKNNLVADLKKKPLNDQTIN